MKTKNTFLLLFAVLLISLFAMAGCSGNTTKDENAVNEGTTATDADREVAENNMNKAEKNITFTLTSPKEDEEITNGTLNLTGKVEGEAKEVKAKLMLEDETVIGEATAMVADVSYEFTTDIKYTIPEDKKSDTAMNAKLKLVVVDKDGNEVHEKTIGLKVK